ARIAREMHDIVAHNLAVMVALADGAAAVTPGAPARGVDMMRQTAMTGRQALTEVRKLVGLLRFSNEVHRFSKEAGRFSEEGSRLPEEVGRFSKEAGRFSDEAGRFSDEGHRLLEEDLRSPPPGLADLDELVSQVRAAGLTV